MMTFLFTPDEKLAMKIRFETKNNGEFNSYLDYVGFIVNSFEASILNSSIIGIVSRIFVEFFLNFNFTNFNS